MHSIPRKSCLQPKPEEAREKTGMEGMEKNGTRHLCTFPQYTRPTRSPAGQLTQRAHTRTVHRLFPLQTFTTRVSSTDPSTLTRPGREQPNVHNVVRGHHRSTSELLFPACKEPDSALRPALRPHPNSTLLSQTHVSPWQPQGQSRGAEKSCKPSSGHPVVLLGTMGRPGRRRGLKPPGTSLGQGPSLLSPPPPHPLLEKKGQLPPCTSAQADWDLHFVQVGG